MARERIRSIKPEWLEDERLAAATDTARMVSVALIVLSDDYGNGRAHPLYLASRVWPYDSRDPQESLTRLDAALRELQYIGFLTLYEVKKQLYFSVNNWSRHQRVQHPSKPLVPGPKEADSDTNGGSNGAIGKLSRESTESLAPDLDQGPGRGEECGTTNTPEDFPEDDERFGPEPYAGLRLGTVNKLWHELTEHVHAGPKAVAAFKRIAEITTKKAGARNAEKALRVGLIWLSRAPVGPVGSGRIKSLTPWAAADRWSNDLDAAQTWWLDGGGREWWQQHDPKRSAAGAA